MTEMVVSQRKMVREMGIKKGDGNEKEENETEYR